MVFIQDNARYHLCPEIIDHLNTYGISVLPFPPYSPALNPIENMWSLLKTYSRALSEIFELVNSRGDMISYANMAWETVSSDHAPTAVKSFEKRIANVIENGGKRLSY